MKSPPARGEVTRASHRPNPAEQLTHAPGSLPPSLPRVEKATPSEPCFCLVPETSPSVNSMGGLPYHNSDTPSEGPATPLDAPAGGRQRESRRARQPGGERPLGATRPAARNARRAPRGARTGSTSRPRGLPPRNGRPTARASEASASGGGRGDDRTVCSCRPARPRLGGARANWASFSAIQD